MTIFSSLKATSPRKTASSRWMACGVTRRGNWLRFWVLILSGMTVSKESWECVVAAHTTMEIASPESRRHFEAYARGVNAFIESHRERLPLEFRLLHYQPGAWTPEDSALIAGQMVEDLTHYSYRSTLTREKILAKLGPQLTADLYVNSSPYDRPPTVARDAEIKPANNEDGDDEDSGPENSVVRNLQPSAVQEEDLEPSLLAGSNNWVISGTHTVSGKPLLSNDMHLATRCRTCGMRHT